MPRRDPLLRRRQTGDLGDQDAPVGVVGPLQSEILAPVQQQIGGCIAAEQVAQPAKLRGMLFVKEDRLQVQPVEQHQPAQAVGPLDRLGISPEPLGHPGDQVANLRRIGLVLLAVRSVLRPRSGSQVPRFRERLPASRDAASLGPTGLNVSLIKTPRAVSNTATAKVRFIDGLVRVRGFVVDARLSRESLDRSGNSMLITGTARPIDSGGLRVRRMNLHRLPPNVNSDCMTPFNRR